tara:strand:- start:2020 stop:2754 length:735 start_codon:yes stop_codon:yes gene_type:complete
MSVILKRKFGQNFLIDKNILNKIYKLIHSENLSILEIGPGDGNLTDKIILKKPSNLTLIEIDKDLIGKLSKKFKHIKNIEIINDDILKSNLNRSFDLVISNLPYNISSQILVKLSTLNFTPELLILMFQKEFGMRLLDNKLNSINSLVKCFYNIDLSFHVSRNCFRPVPKVDSSVLVFKKIKKELINNHEINNYISFKRKLFSHKRKSLRNLLKNYDFNKKFDLDLRVEDLKLDQLINIFRSIN